MPQSEPLVATVEGLVPGPTHVRTLKHGVHLVFGREEWAGMQANIPLVLSLSDLNAARGLNEPVSLDEVGCIYLPLARLLSLHISATRNLNTAVQTGFLGRPRPAGPYIIGVAGSVAVGKSTFARLLRTILSQHHDHPKVDLVTSDGFLYSTSVLNDRGILHRKGFPETYDIRRMLSFLASVKAGEPQVMVPLYSHTLYDIIPDEFQMVSQPDILIFEGLNVLQTVQNAQIMASDFFNFSVYIDADPVDIETWYVERFLLLQRSAFQTPTSYFHHYKDLNRNQAIEIARQIWQRTNLPNLIDNIQPTRERANLVLRKSLSHAVVEVWLRQL